MPCEHVRLEGGHQFVAGTILQGNVHRHIIRKGLVLECLDRLVMLDDFGLFHIFCLDVLYITTYLEEIVTCIYLPLAVELFEQANTSILEVSLSVGFHNLSYFHRAFKNKYGMTPRSFIKELK